MQKSGEPKRHGEDVVLDAYYLSNQHLKGRRAFLEQLNYI
jgi:hypothetical protein